MGIQANIRCMSRLRRLWQSEAVGEDSGQTLVEFAITITVLLTAVFTLIEICLALYTYSTISECACEGTRYAIVRGSTCVTAGSSGAGASCTASAAAVNSYVSSLAYPNVGGGSMTVTTKFSADGSTFTTSVNNVPNDIVQVQVSYPFLVRLPFVPRNTFTLRAQSQMTIIQ
jgi:Flp pilus assembly protein TadG